MRQKILGKTTNPEEKIDSDAFRRFQVQSLKLGLLMDEARHYLMGVDPNKTSGEDIISNTLDKLGFGKNGLESNFWTDLPA